MSIKVENDDSIGKCLNILELFINKFDRSNNLSDLRAILDQAMRDHENNIKEWDGINIRYKE